MELPSNGTWWNSTQWTPNGGFPSTDDTADLSIAGAAFTVTMTDGTIKTTNGGSLTITGYEVGNIKLGANATLVASTSLLDIQYGVVNSGTIVAYSQLEVGYTTANAVVSFTSLTSGAGHIVLNGATGATLSGHAVGIELDLHGQSVEGSGAIQQLKLKVFDDSRINANVNGQTLTVAPGDDILNNGLLEATNGGILTLSGAAIRQAPFASGNLSGVISASDQSTVYLASDTIYGGSISETGSGNVTMSDNNNMFDGSTAAGAVTFANGLSSFGYNFVLNGVIHNQGVLTPVAGTLYVGASDVTLDSGGASIKGQVTLAGGGLNSVDNSASSQTLTNVDNQINGYGAISNLILKNQSGVINANVNGQTLTIDASDTLKNDALVEATNGGTLQIINQTLDAAVGSHMSTDASSHISIGTDTILGGTQSATLNFIDNNNVFDGSTNSGAVLLAHGTLTSGYNLTLKGTIHNDGELSAASGAIAVDAAGVTLDSAGGPAANSYLYLSGGSLNSTTNTAQGSALDLVSSQINGFGGIYNLKLTNEHGSSINANTLDDVLNIGSSDQLINKGMLEATNGGRLELFNQTLTYQAGVSYVVGAGSQIAIATDTFQGGTFAVASTGTYAFVDNNNVFDGSTSAGAVMFSQVIDTSGYNVTWNGAIHNKGAFAVQSGTVEIGGSGVTLDSGGAAIKGQIVLAGGAVNSLTSTAASGVLDDVDNSIVGYGGLYDLNLTVEAGAKINANASGQTLSIDASDQVLNKGLIEATNGGRLNLYNQTLAYQAGSSYAVGAGSQIAIASDTFQGGTFTVTSTGAYVFVDNNNVFDGSTAAGAETFSQAMDTSGYNVTWDGAIHNKGAFAIHGGALEIGALAVTLDSGGAATKGQFILAGGSVNSLSNTALSGVIDDVDNQIAGYGSLYNLKLTVEAGAQINANVSAQTLQIDGSSLLINKGLVEATNGGTLSVSNQFLVYQTGGTYLAGAGSKIALASDTIQGGLLTVAGNGAYVFVDSDNLFDGSTSAGAVTFAQGMDTSGLNVTFSGAIHNKGAFGVRGGTLEVGASPVKLDSGGAATKGQIVLAGGFVNSVANTAASGILDNVDNQIGGYGSLYNLKLTNEVGGVVIASAAAKTLSIDSSDSVTNKGSLEATAGFLSLTGGTINNAGGTILANGGEVDLRSVTITRGTLDGLGASAVHIVDSSVLLDASNVSNGLTLLGNFIVNTGQTVTMDGSVVNKGALKLTANAALTLGDSAGTAATLTNAAGAVLNIGGNFGVSHGSSTASKILNSGLIQKSAGAGLSVISTSISGSGGVEDDTGALDLTGPSNVLSGALTGAGKIDFSGGGSTTLASGASASVANLYMFDAGTIVRLQTNLSYGGTFTQAGNTSLTMSPNVTLTLTGASSLGGAIFGSANLVMTGGSASLTPTAAITTTTWSSTGTALTFSGAHTYSGIYSATSETMTLNGLLKFAGAATLTGVTLKGTNQAQFGKGVTLSGGLTLGGATSLVNTLSVSQSGGNVVLGDSTGGVTKLVNTGASTTWAFTDDFGVALGNSAASSINNTGIFEKTGGGGVSTIAAAVTNAGKLEALSGVLDVKGAVSGKGSDIVSGASTLEFDSTVAGAQTVMFQDAGSVLDLTNWGKFSGAVSGFDTVGSSDAIDVSGPWTWVGFNQSAGAITFADGATQHSVKLIGSYLAADFHNSVVGGVTQVTYG